MYVAVLGLELASDQISNFEINPSLHIAMNKLNNFRIFEIIHC